ncbi:MAG: BACON domain-containing protein [Bacteroidales bacterium]|nr:BACON domain-containing protein [Bacteroidales bacterium]
MTRKILFLLGAAVLCLAACQKPELTLSGPSNLESAVSGGSASITFTATKDWTASAKDSWVRVSPTSGKGSKKPVTVSVTCEPNSTYDDRTSTVTITSEDLKQTVTVKQGASNGLLVTSKSFEVGAAATTIEVAVQANVNFTAKASADWIKQTGTKALSESKLVFSIEENKAFEERNATITISGEGLTQTVSVKQAAAENPSKDLYGTWKNPNGSFPVLNLKQDGTFTYTAYEGDTEQKGTWSYDGSNLTRTFEGSTDKDVAPVVLTGGKAWLVLVYDDEFEIDGTTIKNRICDIYRKDGATVASGTLTDGRWDAPHDGVKPAEYTDQVDYNMCLLVEGNTVDLYVPIWGEHIQGTFTLSDGKMSITTDDDHIWKALEIEVTDQDHWSFGWNASNEDGEYNMNPETFELRGEYKWYTINQMKEMGEEPSEGNPEYRDHPWRFKFQIYLNAENEHEIAMDLCNFGFCVADSGTEAYGFCAGMGKCFYKR